MIVIVDYGMGNLASVAKAFAWLGCPARVSSDPAAVTESDALVLPGVGAFGDAMANLGGKGLLEPIIRAVRDEGKPFLGICLGLQMLFDSSEENGSGMAGRGMSGYRGMGILPGRIRRFSPDDTAGLKVPHMGWNTVTRPRPSRLLEGIDSRAWFYFVHSYYLDPESCDGRLPVATTDYGTEFVAAIETGHIHATQFHPEKSGVVGMRVLRNFIMLAGGKCHDHLPGH